MDLIQQDTEQQASVFSALADPTRLKLVKLLCHQQEANALCVNALAGLLGVTQSAVSQHLRILKVIGLVRGERRGYYIHYYVNRDKIKHCQQLIWTALDVEESAREESCESYCPARSKPTGNKRKPKSPNLD